MTVGDILAVCTFMALACIGVALLFTVAAVTIIVSWWQGLAMYKNQLPQLLQNAVYELAARQIGPLVERLDEAGRPSAQPVDRSNEVDLEHEFDRWLVNR